MHMHKCGQAVICQDLIPIKKKLVQTLYIYIQIAT